MHVFITGATGWIGSAAVGHLLEAGHEITGLARSDTAAATLEERGVRVRRGDLDDLDGLRAGADEADAVIHLANKHDWGNPAETNRTERAAVEAIGEALAGSHRPFVVATGLAGISSGRACTEQDPSPFHGVDSLRGGAENLALEFAEKGVGSIVVRFAPSVHGDGDYGFLPALVRTARDKGASAYIGEGTNRWAAIHRDDAGRVVQLAVDKGVPAGTVLHAIAEIGIRTRELAEAVGRGLGLPVISVEEGRAAAHFGWLNRFYGMDMGAENDATRALLGWVPRGLSLIEDLDSGCYYRPDFLV